MGLQEIIMKVIENNVFKLRPRNSRFLSWFTSEIMNLANEKRRAHCRFKSSSLKADNASFSALRKSMSRAIVAAKNLWARILEAELRSSCDTGTCVPASDLLEAHELTKQLRRK